MSVVGLLLAARSLVKDPFSMSAVMDGDSPVSLYTSRGAPTVVTGQIEREREKRKM